MIVRVLFSVIMLYIVFLVLVSVKSINECYWMYMTFRVEQKPHLLGIPDWGGGVLKFLYSLPFIPFLGCIRGQIPSLGIFEVGIKSRYVYEEIDIL